jgi:hypothetical protein
MIKHPERGTKLSQQWLAQAFISLSKGISHHVLDVSVDF